MTATVELPDLATQQGVELYVASVQRHAREYYDARGSHEPMAHIFLTRPWPGAVFLEASGIGVVGVTARTIRRSLAPKQEFADHIKHVVLAARGIGVVLIVQGWIPELATDAETREGVVVSVEHIRLEAEWHAFIRRDDSGKGTLGEFRRLSDFTRREGRFAGLLHRERFA